MKDELCALWLSLRWSDLRNNLAAVLRRHSAPFTTILPAKGQEFERAWDTFLQASILDLQRRQRHAKGEWPDMFGMAIGLMGEAGLLRDHLSDHWDRLVADGRIGRCDPEAEFNKIVRIALRDMRKRVMPLSPDRQKTWNRLDRISRDLSRASPYGKAERCTRTHFREILDHCFEAFPDDKALPRTLNTIEEYFYENCPDCLDVLPEDTDKSALADRQEFSDVLSAEELMLLPDADARISKLSNCLKKLEAIERDVVEMAYGLGVVSYPSVAIFCSSRTLSRRDFYQLRSDAEAKLKDCVFSLRS